MTFTITCGSKSLQNIDAHLSLFSTSPNDAKCCVVMPHVRHLVHMAVKAEQVHSGPTKGREDMSWRRGYVLVQQTGLQVAHELRASSHDFLCRQNLDHAFSVVCDSTRAATCALA